MIDPEDRFVPDIPSYHDVAAIRELLTRDIFGTASGA